MMEPTGRRRIGPAEVQAIEDLPGENYLLDVETALYDVTFHYKLSRDWTAYAIAPPSFSMFLAFALS